MKRALILTGCALFLFASFALAGGPKNYQATGTVLEVKDGMVILDKGKEGKWEIALGGLQAPEVGSKVKIEYTMTAAKIEVQSTGKPAEKPAKPSKK